MTIRVLIRNDEQIGGRTIVVYTVERPRTGSSSETFTGSVKPQTQQEFYIHAARHLIVAEEP